MDAMMEMVGRLVNAEKENKSYENGHVRLGDLIKFLRDCKLDADVYFDFCDFQPTTLGGYRGYYSDLALDYAQRAGTKVSQLLPVLEEAIGKNFEGYKGGDNYMSEKTPLWVASYGDCHSTAIVGFENAEHAVYLKTGRID